MASATFHLNLSAACSDSGGIAHCLQDQLMHPIRLLAKLAPKTQHYHAHHSEGLRTSAHLDWTDAAHALSGLPDEVTAWALYRFAGQESQLKAVLNHLTSYATMYCKISKFKFKSRVVEGLVRLAVIEHTNPICQDCQGHGRTLQSDVCEACNGRGRLRMSLRRCATIIGIDHKNVSARHDDVVKELLRLLGEWESSAIGAVRRRAETECACNHPIIDA